MGRVREGWPSAKMKEGDVVRSVLDGEAYIITKIVNSMVVLKPKDSETLILTAIDTLRIFYKPIE
jgi:hypothetical protein